MMLTLATLVWSALLACPATAFQTTPALSLRRSLSLTSASPQWAVSPVSKPMRQSLVELKATDATEFWEGDWVCADCGYVYSSDERPKFEQLPRGWKCPQCQGPKRRFSKKIGDIIQMKNDAPIYIFTLVGLVGLAAIVLFADV